MTKLQLAGLRQKVRLLRGRRSVLERVTMGFVPMVAASLLERRFRSGGPAAYYLSIPHPNSSRHRYVRKTQVDQMRRQTDAWREFSQAMADWVRVNDEIERLLRQLGKGRCRRIDLDARKSR
jgi:hypothetical protein